MHVTEGGEQFVSYFQFASHLPCARGRNFDTEKVVQAAGTALILHKPCSDFFVVLNLCAHELTP